MNKQSKKNRVEAGNITDVLTEADYTPMTASEIADRFELRGGAIQALRRLLHKMTISGEIVIVRNNRYTLGSPADLLAGKLEVSRSKMGFLNVAGSDKRIRIFPENQGTALPGDTVSVRLEPVAQARRRNEEESFSTGKVIRVLERSRRLIVGTLRSTGRFWYVVPIDPSYDKDFYVLEPHEAKEGDRVVIAFANWENRHVNPEGEIVEVIGPADMPSTDTLAIIRHYDLPEEFPEDVMREAELAAQRLNEPGQRRDFRGTFVFTVDPETARDFDDALSLERDEQGRRVLGIHIADVSHFVKSGSALDEEAYKRGNSVYLPDRVLPMLPEQLSNGLCSLRPHEDRLAFSVWITFDENGAPLERQFARSLINSRARLTYEQVMPMLQSQQDAGDKAKAAADNKSIAPAAKTSLKTEHLKTIADVNRLAQQLRTRRFQRNALDLDVPEWDVRIDGNGLISAIIPRTSDISHQMIEECMIAANEAVDTELSRRGVPLIHRVHDTPGETKLQELAANLADMGLQPGNLGDRRNLVQFLRSIADHPLKHRIHIEILKSMQRAEYSAEARGHFGLAKKYYTHFTSPIRRYPDLILHRILAATLAGRGGTPKRAELDRRSGHCSATERNAEAAEKALIEIKKFRYLQQALKAATPPVFCAHIVKVVNFGLFVELDELQLQGLVHVSGISPEFVRFDAARQTLRSRKRLYRAGMPLSVHVTRVDFDKRQVDFIPADEPGATARASGRPTPPGRRRTTGRRAARRR